MTYCPWMQLAAVTWTIYMWLDFGPKSKQEAEMLLYFKWLWLWGILIGWQLRTNLVCYAHYECVAHYTQFSKTLPQWKPFCSISDLLCWYNGGYDSLPTKKHGWFSFDLFQRAQWTLLQIYLKKSTILYIPAFCGEKNRISQLTKFHFLKFSTGKGLSFKRCRKIFYNSGGIQYNHKILWKHYDYKISKWCKAAVRSTELCKNSPQVDR